MKMECSWEGLLILYIETGIQPKPTFRLLFRVNYLPHLQTFSIEGASEKEDENE